MILEVVDIRPHDAPVPRLGHAFEQRADRFLRVSSQVTRYLVVPEGELRQRVAPRGLPRRVEREFALARRDHVVVGPHARGATRRARAPVGEEGIAKEQAPGVILEAGFTSHRGFPYAQVVPQILVARGLPHELLGEQRVLFVDAGIEFERQVDERLHVAMAREVLADEPAPVGNAIGILRTARQQQEVCAPGVARCHDERLRAELDLLPHPVAMHRRRRDDAARGIVDDETSDDRLGVQRDLPLRPQRIPGLVRRVLGADRADREAGVVSAARTASVVGLRRLGRRLAPGGDARRVGPLLEHTKVVRKRQRRHRERLGPGIHVARPLLPAHAETHFGFVIVRFEFFI